MKPLEACQSQVIFLPTKWQTDRDVDERMKLNKSYMWVALERSNEDEIFVASTMNLQMCSDISKILMNWHKSLKFKWWTHIWKLRTTFSYINAYLISFQALTLLSHPFICRKHPEMDGQIKKHFLFSVELLARLVSGKRLSEAGYFEPFETDNLKHYSVKIFAFDIFLSNRKKKKTLLQFYYKKLITNLP